MNIKALIEELKSKPGYLKSSPTRVSARFKVSSKIAHQAIREAKKLLRDSAASLSDFDNSNGNHNVITEFEQYLINNQISKEDVSSVKFWQTMGGEQRFSVVTKSGLSVEEIKKEIEDFASQYSPTVFKQTPPPDSKDAVAYEISLPDIHYGKLTDLSIEGMEAQFLDTIQNLMTKAKGLNIQKIILPIGNDGLNSEGLRMTTTKGTPQHDAIGWRETFRGYCELVVRGIDYLKKFAPVDVIVVSGNHDFERMFYAGDFIKGWYRNDKNVTVNNSTESRKYIEFGVNMIMYTHGDKEKASEMPLIMATEKPEMFARCRVREVHCGHLHKEMVNEYRGVKVRFIPSICANDDWHKTMGYESLRVAQGYIWSYDNGLEGYLQSNVK